MTSQAGLDGGGSQHDPNQCFEKIKTVGENVLSCLRAMFQILSSICLCWKVVMTVLAVIGGIGLAGRMLYRRWRAFTEADINMGLMSEPAVPRHSDPTFEIHPSIE